MSGRGKRSGQPATSETCLASEGLRFLYARKDDADCAYNSSSDEGDVNDNAEDDDDDQSDGESDDGKPSGLQVSIFIPRGLADAEGLAVADRPTMSVWVNPAVSRSLLLAFAGLRNMKAVARRRWLPRVLISRLFRMEWWEVKDLSLISTAPIIAGVGPVGSCREVAPIQAQTEEAANELVASEIEFMATLIDALGLAFGNMLISDAEDVRQLAAMPSDLDVRTLVNELGYVGMEGREEKKDREEETETHPSKDDSETGNVLGHLRESSGQLALVVTSPPTHRLMIRSSLAELQ